MQDNTIEQMRVPDTDVECHETGVHSLSVQGNVKTDVVSQPLESCLHITDVIIVLIANALIKVTDIMSKSALGLNFHHHHPLLEYLPECALTDRLFLSRHVEYQWQIFDVKLTQMHQFNSDSVISMRY